MAKTRELKRRIKSVEGTRQITRTMEMVATSRLKRARDRVAAARPYAQALAEVLGDLYEPSLAERFPLLRQPEEQGKVVLLFITSNRGLCGGFNANLIRRTKQRIGELEAEGAEVELHAVGRKGIGFFKYTGRTMALARDDIGDRPSAEHAIELVTPLMERFESGELDALEVVFAKFNTPMSTPPTLMPILPIGEPEGERQGGRVAEQQSVPNYILKPSAEALLRDILPMYVQNQMYRALVETAASEHGARRTAMKSATDNAGDMLDYLRRNFNRARQAQITQEIAEIVGGAEALKG
jgi:F-type H+-transporting ATPase subunit gamma